MSGREDKQDRGARLAEALRENLRRRKAQARSRREPRPDATSENAEPGSGVEEDAAEDGRRD